MGNFSHLQHKRPLTSNPDPSTPSLLRSIRQYAAVPSPPSEQVASIAKAQPDRFARLGHSFATFPIFPGIQRMVVLPSHLQGERQLQPRIEAAKSNGHPIDKHIRLWLERALDADLTRVRVHTNTDADHLS